MIVSLSKSSLYLIITIFPFVMNSYKFSTLFENLLIFFYISTSLLGSFFYSWLFPPKVPQKNSLSLFQIVSILFVSISFLSMIVDYDSMFFLCFIISGIFSYAVIPVGSVFCVGFNDQSV